MFSPLFIFGQYFSIASQALEQFLLQEQLNHGNRHVWLLYRHLERDSIFVSALACIHVLLPRGFAELDLRGIVEKLGILDLSGKAIEVKLPERPDKYVHIQPSRSWIIGQPAVLRDLELLGCLCAAIDRATMVSHPLTDA